MNVPIEVVIASIGLVAAAIFGITTAVGNLRKEAKADGAQHGNIEQKLDNLLRLLTDVKADISSIKLDNTNNRERIIKIEAHFENICRSVDVLFRRIRDLESHVPTLKEKNHEES